MKNREIVRVCEKRLGNIRHSGTDEFREGVRAGVVEVILALSCETSSPTLHRKLTRLVEEDLHKRRLAAEIRLKQKGIL